MGKIRFTWQDRRNAEEVRHECECGREFNPATCDDEEKLLCNECNAKADGSWDFRIRETYNDNCNPFDGDDPRNGGV